MRIGRWRFITIRAIALTGSRTHEIRLPAPKIGVPGAPASRRHMPPRRRRSQGTANIFMRHRVRHRRMRDCSENREAKPRISRHELSQIKFVIIRAKNSWLPSAPFSYPWLSLSAALIRRDKGKLDTHNWLAFCELDAAATLGFLNAPSGNRLEKLKGDRAGQWSIRINDRWRVCFRWDDSDAWDVEIVDYH
jgi:plasmid maintenance system killer protein